MPRLHINIDHVATLRQARREAFPDPIAWALAAEEAGAEGITCHLRKDRRHIQDADVVQLRAQVKTLLNLESSLDEEMLALAEKSGAEAFCLVPENREEVTTEGGLNVVGEAARLREAIPRLTSSGGLVSLFIDPDLKQIDMARELQAPFIELHTGEYAKATGAARQEALERLANATAHAKSIGLRVNAGHGLDYENTPPVASIPHIEELNIGFAIVARSVFVGVSRAIGEMQNLLDGTTASRA
ncbi:MAG: pyridoxine 5'-phosphate synthase [Planctomycetota bacterium]|nr:pyridoxine 5'-phosphate synthase [Planctomycetota bacterium]